MKKTIISCIALSLAVLAASSAMSFRDTTQKNNDNLITVNAAEEEKEAFPDWIPKSFDEAAAFEEKYGRTHTGDKYACVLFRKKDDEQLHVAYNSSPQKFKSNSKDFSKVTFDIPAGKTEEPGTICENGEYSVFIFRFRDVEYLSIVDYINEKSYRFVSDENGEPVETEPVPGDSDGNGLIDASDVLLLQKVMVMGNKNTTMPFYFDMNADGEVNITDLCLIKDALFNF